MIPEVWKSTELKPGFRVRLQPHEDGSGDRHTVVGSTVIALGEDGMLEFMSVQLRNDRTGREDLHLAPLDYEWVQWR